MAPVKNRELIPNTIYSAALAFDEIEVSKRPAPPNEIRAS
jgi:hypothetical protein